LSHQDLSDNYGLTYSDAIRLKAAKEIIRRSQVAEVLDKPKISGSRDAFLVMQHLGELCYEEFWIVVLNRANRVIDRIKFSEGGISGTVVNFLIGNP
jgi:DNA repair protein RadC